MIADMAGVPLYVVHVSCEEAHEAIRRARQLGKRVWGEPLIQHLTLDDSEYFHPDWDHAARRVMSPPFRNKAPGQPVERVDERVALGRGDGPLRLHHRAEALRRGRFHQDPERHRGAGGPAADALDPWRADGPADAERVRRRHVDQHRQDPELLPEKGCDPGGRRCRYRGLGPREGSKTITAGSQQSAIDYNVFEGKEVKGLPRFTLTAWAGGRP
jgi:dihydropyrimidinase